MTRLRYDIIDGRLGYMFKPKGHDQQQLDRTNRVVTRVP